MDNRNKIKPLIFISYAWNDRDRVFPLIDNLKDKLASSEFDFVTDEISLNYKGSISDFMKRDGIGKYVILIITHNYLTSQNCMFEFNEILRNDKFNDKYFPIISKDTNLFLPINRLQYVQFWESKINEIEKKIKNFEGNENLLNQIYYSLNTLSNIRNNIAHNLDYLSNMNILQIDDNFENTNIALSNAIETRNKLENLKRGSNES